MSTMNSKLDLSESASAHARAERDELAQTIDACSVTNRIWANEDGLHVAARRLSLSRSGR
ncbi:hypothetical protein GT037_002501 [Alternaria burnsii]|jgi:hypothetical protein|uniref:Uncharacterized protein n=1 Tax=Alternaria burnsii TaxID=1187904 RepID=A0A8H7EI44_9PLEO|nr:uncharacterized protein GT037_002501 [Alternaria burnsii]KAF7680850.1 hypothetical protein GT037_002501 [Alternaria burnsii]